MVVLWVLVALLLLFAIVGGVAISKFLFFVLIVAAILRAVWPVLSNSLNESTKGEATKWVSELD